MSPKLKKISEYVFIMPDASFFFRLAFGLMMLLSLIRFMSYGWIKKFILIRNFILHIGFQWVKPFGNYTYLLFIIAGLAALFVAIGYKYKWLSLPFLEFYLHRATRQDNLP
jgi:hypothetical protein